MLSTISLPTHVNLPPSLMKERTDASVQIISYLKGREIVEKHRIYIV